ncbi:MAG: hypothetical protein U1F36_11300 [Planctomycetota bacterium]
MDGAVDWNLDNVSWWSSWHLSDDGNVVASGPESIALARTGITRGPQVVRNGVTYSFATSLTFGGSMHINSSTGPQTHLGEMVFRARFSLTPAGDLDDWRSPCLNCFNHALGVRDRPYLQVPTPPPPLFIDCGWFSTYVNQIGSTAPNWPGPPAPMPPNWPQGACPTGFTLVGLSVIDPAVVLAYRATDPQNPDVANYPGDFHWYRFHPEAGGCTSYWTQKHGTDPAQATDDARKPMDASNPPHRANIAPYVFCRYLCVPDNPSLLVNLVPGPPWDIPAGGSPKVISLDGQDGTPRSTDATDLQGLAAHLPSGIPAPAVAIRHGIGFRGHGLIADPAQHPGLPPYLEVADGVVSLFSDIRGDRNTTITRLVDDRGLSEHLAAILPPPSFEAFGSPCSSPNGPVLHAAAGTTRPGGTVMLLGANMVPNQIRAFVLGAQRIDIEFPGLVTPCHLVVDPLLLAAGTTDASGRATQALTIPADPLLIGTEILSQLVLLGPGIGPVGIATSNGILIRVRG